MISDLLITDYSSVFFDYANLKRPMLFYVPDIETYRDKLRGFYFDFEQEAPGPLVKETSRVIEWVRETEQPTFTLPPSFTPFYEKFCYLEAGESSKRVVEVVFSENSKKVPFLSCRTVLFGFYSIVHIFKSNGKIKHRNLTVNMLNLDKIIRYCKYAENNIEVLQCTNFIIIL